MIKGIIHSVDNPYRLKQFLDSYEQFAANFMELKVFYSVTNEEFIEQYQKLGEEYKYDLEMTSQVKDDVVNYIKEDESSYICLLTDEDVFYRRVNKSRGTIVNKLFEEHKDLLAFSLRLGRNVKNNKQFQSYNVIIPLNKETDNYLLVDWSKHYLDFGFPLCVHGHIFRRNEIRKLISKVPFSNFDELQENLLIFEKFPKHKLASLDNSVLVTDVAAPSQESDILIRKILNIKLSKGDYKPVKIDKNTVDGIQSNFGIYAMLLKNMNNEQ